MSTQARQKLLEVAEQKGTTRYDGYETAFKQLADVVDEKVFDNMDIMKMTELRDTSLDNAGWGWQSQTQKQKHYGDRLSFWQPHNKMVTEIIFSKDVSTGHAVEAVVVATEMTNAPLPSLVEGTTHNKTHQVFRCAQKIRSELMTVRDRMAWPPTPAYLVENNVDIPDLVARVLCGDSDDEAMSADRPTPSDQKHRHVMSIAQDFLHCVSSGRVMTPVTVKHLTESSQLVKILNHFGHSLSNSLIQEVETAISQAECWYNLEIHTEVYILIDLCSVETSVIISTGSTKF